jgi:23S rRNA (guanine745-N1)-methyltransferase
MLGIEADKDDRLAEAMSGHFDLESTHDLDIPMNLTPAEVADLAFMGPAGHHLNRADLIQRVSGLAPKTAVEARFRITVLGLAGHRG